MTGFFRDIKGYFEAAYGGRYFAILLRELARHEPRSFARIIDDIAHRSPHAEWKKLAKRVRSEHLKAEIEHWFDAGNGKRRRADLALIDDSNKAIALFEIKELDHKNPANPEQTQDYLSYAEREAIPFIHISRFEPEPDHNAAFRESLSEGRMVSSIRYGHIYTALSRASGSITPMICEYLEDLGVGVYQLLDLSANKDGKAMAYLVTRMCMFPWATGLGKLHSDDAIEATSALFKKVFGNLEFFAEHIRSANPYLFSIRFTREFRVYPEFNLEAVKNAIDQRKSRHARGRLPGDYGKYVQAGTLEFEAWANILADTSIGDRLWVSIGYNFEVEKGRKQPLVKTRFFTSFWATKRGQRLWGRNETGSTSNHRTKLTENASHHLLQTHLKESLEKARKLAKGDMLKPLRNFQIPG